MSQQTTDRGGRPTITYGCGCVYPLLGSAESRTVKGTCLECQREAAKTATAVDLQAVAESGTLGVSMRPTRERPPRWKRRGP